MFTQAPGQEEIDITDKAEWSSSNPLVLLPMGKQVIRDPQGRVVGSEMAFRLINPGTATVTAFAQGLKATSRVDLGLKVPMPTPVAPPSTKHLWVALGVTGLSLLVGIVGAINRGR